MSSISTNSSQTRSDMTDNNKQSEFCQSFACDLQTCLNKNLYNPDKCKKVLNRLKQCCLEHGSESPVVCSGFPTSKPSSSPSPQ